MREHHTNRRQLIESSSFVCDVVKEWDGNGLINAAFNEADPPCLFQGYGCICAGSDDFLVGCGTGRSTCVREKCRTISLNRPPTKWTEHSA